MAYTFFFRDSAPSLNGGVALASIFWQMFAGGQIYILYSLHTTHFLTINLVCWGQSIFTTRYTLAHMLTINLFYQIYMYYMLPTNVSAI